MSADGSPVSEGEALQNHMLCANAATAIGCGVRDLAPQQLAAAPEHPQLVLALLWNLAKKGLLGPLLSARRAGGLDHLMAEVPRLPPPPPLSLALVTSKPPLHDLLCGSNRGLIARVTAD